jgi:hypothetical protein
MKKTVWTGVCTAIVGFAAAAVTAQTPAAPQSASAADQKITITGCLKEAPATPAPPSVAGTTGTTGTTATAGTTGAATDAAADRKFLLINASAAPAAATPDPTAATPPTTAAPPPAAASASDAKTYRLVANPTALTPHIGKKLELTGTLQSAASAGQSASAAGPDANAPILKVETGKVLAASCSE